MKWLSKIKPEPVQAFTPRSDLVNFVLRGGQGLVAWGIGYEVAHAGLSTPVAAVLSTGVLVAGAIAMIGWKREMVRHVQAAA